MDRAEELRQWIDLPTNNLKTARHIAENMRPVPNEIVCNLCHQAVEKFLKCYLFYNNIAFPKIHDLPQLLTLCITHSDDFMQFLKKCGFMNNYAVMPRYPNELQITDDDAQAAIRYAEEIKDFVLAKVETE